MSFSVTGKKWVYKKFDTHDINFLKENFSLDEITSKLLVIRDINKKEIETFLYPAIKNIMPNPNIIKDMEKTVKRTCDTIFNGEKIGIFGDYDVDGATSTALLGNYLNAIGHLYKIYIPDRRSEGYGPSIKGFKSLINSNVKLIFTVDCGTLSFKPIEYAKDNDIDVIVLDHHQSEINLPKAYSIVNPNRLDDKSNLNYLCAVGVCFMFLVALNKELRLKNWFKKNKINEPNLINFLDLVSLGTICDVVPLVGLNRALVSQGLKIIKAKKNLGLKTLFDICKIDSQPTTYHLGYVIGPRINAGGRVGKCSHGANLLLNVDPKETFKIANELNDFNKERQLLEKNLLKSALLKVENYKDDPIIIIYGKDWHEGVIGIVAARIKDKYNKPTIVISTNKSIGKASARSIVGLDIGSLIISALQENLIIKGGGHKMAGGFTINMDKFVSFKKFILKKFKKKEVNSYQSLFIDCEISPSALNLDFFNKVYNLSPFGSGNPEPKFMIENVKVLNSKLVGESHIKSVLLGKDGSTIKSIAFNAINSQIGSYLLKKTNKNISIAGKLSLNEWKGQKNVEFIIDDISVITKHENTVPSSIG